MQVIKNNTTLLVSLLSAYLIFLVISVTNDLIALKFIHDIENGVISEYIDAFDNYTAVFNIILFILLITVFINAGIWLYRSHKRLRIWEAKNLKFSDASCIWWYFVPLMNLVKPYQTMKETWFASQNPKNWSLPSSPTLLKVWWGLWIVSTIVDNAYFRLSLRLENPTLGELSFLTSLSAFSGLMSIGATIAFLSVVKHVNRMQLDYQDTVSESEKA